MSLACCYTDDATPYCDNRRHEGLAMCRWHTRETMRQAVLDGAMPPDVIHEIVKLTDWFVNVKQLANRVVDRDQTIDIRAQVKAERDARKEFERQQSIVYYIRLTGDRIKIGTTTNMVRRMTDLRVRVADVLATEPGSFPVETARHHQFSHLRHGRLEDFDAHPALLAHIAAIVELHGPPNITTDAA